MERTINGAKSYKKTSATNWSCGYLGKLGCVVGGWDARLDKSCSGAQSWFFKKNGTPLSECLPGVARSGQK